MTMSEFLSSDPDEFDRQLNNHFSGIGKERTILSGTWRNWMNEECEGTDWECLAAWDSGDGLICFNMLDPDEFEQVNAVEKIGVCRVHAARTFAAIRHLYETPRQRTLKAGVLIAPPHVANKHLYEQLFCDGLDGVDLIAEYEALGGEYE